jgi:hypothetical protein
MKQFPITIISILIIALFAIVFATIVPAGGDLISQRGDTILGIIIGIIVGLSIIRDFKVLGPTYRSYYRDNPHGYWFKRKLYGWGWTPVKWQGWVSLLLYVILIFAIAFRVHDTDLGHHIVLTFVVPIVVLTAVFIGIAYLKGESPKWQWGPKE